MRIGELDLNQQDLSDLLSSGDAAVAHQVCSYLTSRAAALRAGTLPARIPGQPDSGRTGQAAELLILGADIIERIALQHRGAS